MVGCKRARRGVATIWLILSLPVMLIMLCTAVEVGNVWLARVELETALEAAALAGVKEWKDTSSTMAARMAARTRAQKLAAANTVRGMSVLLDRNEDVVNGDANDNDTCDGDIILGAVTEMTGEFTFDADAASGNFGVRTQKTMSVPLVCSSLFGGMLPSFSVSARTTAMCESPSGSPRLIRVSNSNFICN